MSKKVNLESVSSYFKEFNCELLSKEYINAKSTLKFKCKCGEIDTTTYDSFKHREHKMCKKCAKKISSSKKKLDFEYVKTFFEENGCVLLSTEYKSNIQKLDYICDCGNKSKISFTHFQRGHRCEICWRRKVSEKLSLNYEEVKRIFEENDCVLLEDKYISAVTPMKYICDCGSPSKITLSNFKRGSRCKKCGTKKVADKNRRSIDEIRTIFENENCVLLTENYINTKQYLDYICSCGNLHTSNLSIFLSGGRCKECNIKKLRFSYEYVKNYFEENNCALLTEEYKRSDQILDYICECGRLAKTQFYRFKYGQRCMKCRDERYNIGEKSHSWKGGITSLANYVRGKMTEWKKNTEEICGFKCVLTGNNIYDVHHLRGFNSIFNEAIKILKFPIYKNIDKYDKYQLYKIVDTTLSLHKKYGVGICVSENIHYYFHKQYGFENNTPEQFLEFIKINYHDSYEKVNELINVKIN